MKYLKYILLTVCALPLLASCAKSGPAGEAAPDVSLRSSYTEFEGGQAAVEIRLSHFIHSDVKVTLSVEGIEADAVTYESEVVIPAGSVKKNVGLSIDGKKVELHKDYSVLVKLQSAEGASLTGNTSVSIAARIDEVRNWDYTPNPVSTWNPYPYAYSGYCYIYMYAAPEWYQIDFFPVDEGDLSDPVFLLKKMDAFADEINALYEQYKDVYSAKTDILCHFSSAAYATCKYGTSTHYVGVSDPGRYWLLMMEFDTDLVPTGNYKSDVFTFSN